MRYGRNYGAHTSDVNGWWDQQLTDLRCDSRWSRAGHGAAGSALFDDEPPIESDVWFWHHCCKTQYASVVSNEQMNGIVAGFAGRLSDAITPNYKAQGAIFGHPDFERLETMAREKD